MAQICIAKENVSFVAACYSCHLGYIDELQKHRMEMAFVKILLFDA